MKMKAKRLKKAFAVIMALAVVLSYSMVPAFADPDPTTSIKVKNVETGAKITAYKIIGMDENGKYVGVNGVEIGEGKDIEDIQNPTADEIKNISAKALTKTWDDFTYDGENKEYVKTVAATKANAGLYLIKVTKADGTKEYVYNPMIVAINIDDDGNFAGDEVNAAANYNDDAELYAKRSKPGITKEIKSTKASENSNVESNTGNVKGNTMGGEQKIGSTSTRDADTVTFTLTADVPAYTKVYDNNNLKYNISDKVSEGLTLASEADLKKSVVVKCGNDTLTEGTEYVLTKPADDEFLLTFKRPWLINDLDRVVTVEYSATLNANAASGFDPNTNEVELEYSNDPDGNTGKDTDGTKHYTFDINGNVGGGYEGIVREIVKTGIDETSGEAIMAEQTMKTEKVDYHGLNDAVFGLYTDAACENKIAETTTSDADSNANVSGNGTDKAGFLKFYNLNAGTYYIKEISAPSPYAKSDKVIRVEIKAELDNDELKSYSIEFFEGNTKVAGVEYDNSTGTVERTSDSDATMVNNYKAGQLPSTGGMGTMLFTIAGIALMAIAAGLFLASRRRNAEEE